MTVTLVTVIQRWIGLSTDTKPTPTHIGSTFYETNTGQNWIWDGTSWVEDLAMFRAVVDALKE